MAETAEKPHNSVNGIDTGRIVELATRMAQDGQFGKFRFRVANRWIDGSRSRTSIKDFHAGGDERTERPSALTVDSDQPTYLAGENHSERRDPRAWIGVGVQYFLILADIVL